MSQDNTNRGTIGKNARKTEDKHPDIAGTLNVEGREFWINGWKKTNTSDGSTFYSLSVKPKQAMKGTTATSVDATGSGFTYPGNGNTDDVPF